MKQLFRDAPAEDARRRQEAIILESTPIQSLYGPIREVAADGDERGLIEEGIKGIDAQLVAWNGALGDLSKITDFDRAITRIGQDSRNSLRTEPRVPGEGLLGIENASLTLLRRTPAQYPPFPTKDLQMRIIRSMGVLEALDIDRNINDMRGIVGHARIPDFPATPGSPYYQNMTSLEVDLHWLPTTQESVAITAIAESLGLDFVVSAPVLIASARLAR